LQLWQHLGPADNCFTLSVPVLERSPTTAAPSNHPTSPPPVAAVPYSQVFFLSYEITCLKNGK